MIPKILSEQIKDRQCVAFIGAGFSMPCNMPSWWGLLEWLIGQARRSQSETSNQSFINSAEELMHEGNLDEAADIISKLIPPADLHTSITERFHRDQCKKSNNGANRNRMHDRIKNLLTIPWTAIVTTNYDTLIEDEISRHDRSAYTTYRPNDYDFGMVFKKLQDTPVFVKLHGSVEGGNYVLGTKSYEETYVLKQQVVTFLEHIMLRYCLVFIGCSMESAILELRRKLLEKFHIYPTAYALLPNTDENRKRRRELENKANIWSLLYESQKYNDEPLHMEVDRIIKSLAS